MKNKKGFSLVELIGVIVILGIISLIAITEVNRYVKKTKEQTYETYLKNIETATKNKMINCIKGKEDCNIPEPGDKLKLTVETLIEEGYIEKLQDPEEKGSFCTGYSEVTNNGASVPDLAYQVCLKCSKYINPNYGRCQFTEEEETPVNDIEECDQIRLSASSQNLEWTNGDRVIIYGCNDRGKNCKYQKKFSALTNDPILKTGEVKIKNKICPVEVKIDKTKPTCELSVKSTNIGESGWYLEDATVELTYKSPTISGRAVKLDKFKYGISTSVNKEYNNKKELVIGTGITTVFGYVKDDLGNENYCSKEIKVDSTKPKQNLILGYQIYPEAKNKVDINNNSITINNLEKYNGVKGFLIFFKEPYTGTIKVTSTNFVSSNTQATQSAVGHYGFDSNLEATIEEENYVEFINTKNTSYDDLKISGIKTEKIQNIVLLVGDTAGLYTNKDMLVYIMPEDSGTGISKYSFDNGNTWQDEKYKFYSSNQTVNTKVKDTVGNPSETKSITINNIDKKKPDCQVKGNPTDWVNQNVTLTIKGTDTISGVHSIGLENKLKEEFTTLNATHTSNISSNGNYKYEIEDRAGNKNTCESLVTKIDKVSPTVSVEIIDPNTLAKTKTATITMSDSLSGLKGQKIYYGWTKDRTKEPSYESQTITEGTEKSITVTSPELDGRYYLYVKGGISDKAGNKTEKVISGGTTLDNTPPTCDGVLTISGGQKEKWTNQNISLTVNKNNDIASWRWKYTKDGTKYSLNQDYTDSLTFSIFSETGKYNGTVTLKDSSGNIRECHTGEFWIDKIKPTMPSIVLTHSYDDSKPNGSRATVYNSIVNDNKNWVNKTSDIAEVYMTDARTVDSNGNFSGPSSTDEGGSGIAEYQISKDNHTWVTYEYTYHQNDIYQVSANGENHRYFRAKDHAGNYSDVKERAIYIDKAAPVMNDVVLTHSYNSEKPNGSRAEVYTPGSWINKNVYMTDARTVTNGNYSDPTATDTGGSNLKKIQITNANDCNSNWVDYAYDYHQELYDITQNGNHTRCFRAIDNAGNTSTVVTKNIKIDKIGPTVSLEVIKQGTSTSVKQSSDYVGTNNTKFAAGTYTELYRFYVNGTDSSCGMKDEFMTDMSTTAGTKQKPSGSERYSVYFNEYKSYDGIITVKDKCGNKTEVPFSITQKSPFDASIVTANYMVCPSDQGRPTPTDCLLKYWDRLEISNGKIDGNNITFNYKLTMNNWEVSWVNGEERKLCISDNQNKCKIKIKSWTMTSNWLSPGQSKNGTVTEDISKLPKGNYWVTLQGKSNIFRFTTLNTTVLFKIN